MERNEKRHKGIYRKIRNMSKQSLVITTTSTRAFERAALDIIGSLLTLINNFTHILTLQLYKMILQNFQQPMQ